MPGTQQVCSNYGKKRGGSDWTLAGGPGSDLASPLTYSELFGKSNPANHCSQAGAGRDACLGGKMEGSNETDMEGPGK